MSEGGKKAPLLLQGAQRAEALAELAALGWTLSEGREAVEQVWRFKDFSQAWGFMTRVALRAEALDHHPEWRNVYNRVEVVLSTHSCGGLSALDLQLARAMAKIAAS